MRRKISIFGKQTPIVAIVTLVAMAGIGSATLLNYYGQITGMATVEQSLLVNGQNWDEPISYVIGASPAVAGNTYENGPISIENNADNPINIEFETVAEADYGDDEYVDASDAVTTTYFAKLELDNKDADWEPISEDDMQATLTFDLVSPSFNYKLDAAGLQPSTAYSLIYYADKQDRFVDWGGANPGVLIATGTSNSAGGLVIEGNKDIEMDLVDLTDWNANPDPDYCDRNNGFDSYQLCSGAKIWLVPSSDYNVGTKKLTAWDPSEYLFETDLVGYDDLGNGEGLRVGHGQFGLYIRNTFNSRAMPGTYRISTSVNPVID